MPKPQNGKVFDLFVGTYGTPETEAIHVFRFDSEEGFLDRMTGVSGIDQPSFLAWAPRKGMLYAVSETATDGHVVSYRHSAGKGDLERINSRPTLGGYPCHLSVDASESWLLSVNYMTGSICVYPITSDGGIGPMADFVRHEGRSAHPERQEGPHPHSIVNIPGTELWLVPDLGTDRIYVYRLDGQTGKLELRSITESAPGAGPRHVDFHPHLPMIYVIEELSSAITVYRYEKSTGELTAEQTVPTLPADFQGYNICADIHLTPCGKYLYGSNRGHDSIAAYRVLENGHLEEIGRVPSLGRTPRNFAVDPTGRFLLVANQDTGNIVVMRIGDNGLPVPTGHSVSLEKPVCIRFIK